MYTYHITTFGCQMNISDSERIAALLGNLGITESPSKEEADVIIFNTCSIKQKAEDKVYGHVRTIERMKKQNPDVRFLITGCMVRQSGVHSRYESEVTSEDHLFSMIETLDGVFRIEDMMELPAYMEALYQRNFREEQEEKRAHYLSVLPKYQHPFKAFVPIMTGCNKFCTYCIVPYTRKREISRNRDEIIEEVIQLAKQGIKEITLLGQTVNSYRFRSADQEAKSGFVDLLIKLNRIPGIERIYYTSPHPMDMKDELIEAHRTLEKLCPYIHLPIQSGDNAVLKRMNRNYTREQYLEMIAKLKATVPHCTISTDIIVGFSGETREEFENTLNLYREVAFDFAYISQYSVRKGTYAEKYMEDTVSKEEKKERWHEMNILLKKISHERNNAYLGKTVEVLVEKEEGGLLEGKTRTAKTVHFPGQKELVGKTVQIKIEEALEWLLKGSMIEVIS
jgi:tRNA-2-methylthio-N6-dimethylallyladenosine synthase